jgi:hypothetical protein
MFKHLDAVGQATRDRITSYMRGEIAGYSKAYFLIPGHVDERLPASAVPTFKGVVIRQYSSSGKLLRHGIKTIPGFITPAGVFYAAATDYYQEPAGIRDVIPE